ncbi:unnamed protein product [Arctogadus glacialis]
MPLNHTTMEATRSNLGAKPEPEAVEPEESDSAAAAAAPPPPPSKRKRKRRRTPHRVTLCRHKSRLREDTRVLEEHKGKPQCQPGDPCPTCGQPRTLDTGHALYKSSQYCQTEAGPGGLTPRDWLISQHVPEDMWKVPRTTLWNIARRKAGGQVGGSSPPRRRKTHKLRICQRCLQPAQKDFGHSRFDGEYFCSLYAGKSVDLWLAERRDSKRRKPKR